MNKNIERADNVDLHGRRERNKSQSVQGLSGLVYRKGKRIPYGRGFTWKTIIDGTLRYCPDVDQDTVIGPAGREMGTQAMSPCLYVLKASR
jgi:hypothetical protein